MCLGPMGSIWKCENYFYSSKLIFSLTLGEVTPCLVIGAPTASYGIHTNAGAVHIFDSIDFTYLGKMHADRALARFGRSFTQSEDYVFIGAPRYHEVCTYLFALAF